MWVPVSVHAQMLCVCTLAIAPLAIATSPSGQAQTVSPDQTLPTAVSADSTTRRFTVTGGSAQGSNLFHSFDTFSPGAWAVQFDLSQDAFGAGIERIFSRATGTSPSEINGSLGIIGGNAPDLFLLNPNGIIFGPSATLNLPGSFVGTTAETIQFADGINFGAVANPATEPLLSISVPTGLQFGQNPGTIAVLGNGHHIDNSREFSPSLQDPAFPIASGLSVQPGNTLALVGGPVHFQGAELQSPYQTLSNGKSIPLGEYQLHIGAVATGSVELEAQAWGWDFDYSNIENDQDIKISDRTWLNAGGITPGRIHIHGRNITIDGGSAITVANLGGSPSAIPHGITINASETLKVQGIPEQRSRIRTTTAIQNSNPNQQQDAGALNIFSRTLQVLDGANIDNSTFGIGNSGPLNIQVQENLVIDGQTDPNRPIPSRTTISANTFASGNADQINIQAENLFLTKGGIISASLGAGDAGRVEVEAGEQIVARGFQPLAQFNSGIASVSLRKGSSGEGVFVRAKSLDILDGGRISSSAFGSGDTGVVQLDISDSIRVGGADSVALTEFAKIEAAVILNSAASDPFAEQNGRSGKVGNINIRTGELEGSQVRLSQPPKSGVEDKQEF